MLDIKNKIKNQSLRTTLAKCSYFLFNKYKTGTLLLIFLMIIIATAPSINSLLLQQLIDQIDYYSDQALYNTDLISVLFKWVVIYILWWECLNIVWRIYDYAYLKIMPKIKASVIDEFYNHIQYHDHKFFQLTLVGEIANKITEASRSLEMIFAHANEKILHKLSVLIFAMFTLYLINPNIAMIFLIWILLFVGASIYFAQTINNYSTIYGQDKATVSGQIVDAISNITSIRLFTGYKHEKKYLKTFLDKSIKSDKNMQWFMLKLRYALGLSCSVMITAMIYYVLNLRSNLEISIGQCALIITLCAAVIEDVWDLSQALGDLFEQIGSFSQTMSLLNQHQTNYKDNVNSLNVKIPSIEFKNVTFKYQNNNNKFDNQSIIINPYENVGLIGFSGSGKTTFVGMISRLYEIDAGSILIDGQDISKVSRASLSNNISIVPQEPILFHRSVMDNIRYGKMSATSQEIFEAAQSAHIHDTILNLPDAYDTICGERGGLLSMGQRQRIIIARAFLRNAPILILDEATSSLDTHTEKLIDSSLKKLMEDKTVIVVAHRLSTLLNMDRIIVFDKGKIIEDGSHSKLQKYGNLYKLLWDRC